MKRLSITSAARVLGLASLAVALSLFGNGGETLRHALLQRAIAKPTPGAVENSPIPKPPQQGSPLTLQPASKNANFGLDDQVLRDRNALIRSIDHSLRYLQTPKAAEAYRRYPVKEVSRDRVERSLRRFRQLTLQSRSATELQTSVLKEFALYQSVGNDNQGTVGFTGYFEPVHAASRVRTAEYRYPLFRLPPGFDTWKGKLTREDLEGKDGLQTSRLKGSELVWMRDRLEAFLVQVQGSARLTFTDGSTMTIGVAGLTDQPYTGIGHELVKDGKLRLEDLQLPNVIQYFRQNPADLNVYLPRNQRFVFFRDTGGAPAIGSLGVPVTAERSIATDKALMPPGALALIQTQLPILTAARQLEQRPVNRYVLDQDTGGAIKGAGRVDVFMGTGAQAGDKAGLVNATGQLYYLLLKS
ncbi:murein transglycosylase A [Myxacorys almedinensis]|uniref:peptidoglycan lytic exotransglycosylase n=1 Tax=Myxacorys almedinensis A TaxID=2690445 RepID=A0A8J8CHV7_9CYAN|nr:MltA domain-containing protein [Myxacorys almedinensis]NDJ15846.1 murein transglycosylase [Myxacorys almedinensis A]